MKKWLDSIYSDGSKYFVSNPLPKKGEEIAIKIRILHDAPIKYIIFRTKLNGAERLLKMEIVETINGLDYYQTKVTCYEDELHYHFYIVGDDKVYYYNQKEITTYIPNEVYDFRILYNYNQPSWIKGSVFYQIFPDRFCNGNPNNDVQTGEYTFDGHKTTKMNWNEAPKGYEEVFCLDFYGGDLEGIEQKISYLKELGVNALYLNPIFYAATCHKYDCLDYFHVDPHFGGDEALESLVQALHKNNMRIILDVSINHTGTANKWFNKNGEFFDKKYGAYNNPSSLERNYYFFDENNNYKAWANVPTLPNLNYLSTDLRNIIYRDEYSVVKKWLKAPYNIDGWRFDVADVMARNELVQLHHDIWPEIRNSIKEVNPSAYILAEDWSDCSEFLKGNEWDAPMNYFGCARPIRQFVGQYDLFSARNELLHLDYKMSGAELRGRIHSCLSCLPFVIQENQFNLLDSHDVPRLHNDPQVNKEEYRGAVITMFTLIGCPNIYYGDEANIDGITSTNEGCRYPMPWDKNIQEAQNYSLYKTLAHLKSSEDALINGGMKFIDCEGDVLVFARFNLKDLFITIFSADKETKYVHLDLRIFGKENTAKIKDIFEKKVNVVVEKDEVVIEVPAHCGYLLKL